PGRPAVRRQATGARGDCLFRVGFEAVNALNVALPLGSSLLSFVFAALVVDQWWQRRHSFQLVWAIGLLWYGIAAGTEFLGSAFGWSQPLYRAWYLFGALFVPPYLGLGTIYLLAKSRFGYFAGVTVISGGGLSLLLRKVYAGSATTALVVFAIALAGGIALLVATAVRRPLAAHIAAAVLVLGSILGAYVVLTAPLAAPGWAVDPHTHVPVGSAFPGYVRVITPPDNIAGALILVFGALYSAYVYMPKKRVMPARLGVLAIVPNFFASLPSAAVALVGGKLNSRVPAAPRESPAGCISLVRTAWETSAPMMFASSHAKRKWKPAYTRASSTWATASRKLVKLRSTSCNPADVTVKVALSPKNDASVAAAALLVPEWADGYSWK